MKRSEINAAIRRTIAFLRECHFGLPPFAVWTPQDWESRGHECDAIRDNMLGWDVTDFGLGDFGRHGLVLFTLRNGNLHNPDEPRTYCEKIIVSEEGQECPMHFHWDKVEDIINRAGGELVLQLCGSRPDEAMDTESPMRISLDGVLTDLPAGATVRLRPGESITLVPGLYHSFRAEGGTVLTGEVSAVNDDNSDNRFAEPLGRFPRVEEDEPILHYLCNEYPAAD